MNAIESALKLKELQKQYHQKYLSFLNDIFETYPLIYNINLFVVINDDPDSIPRVYFHGFNDIEFEINEYWKETSRITRSPEVLSLCIECSVKLEEIEILRKSIDQKNEMLSIFLHKYNNKNSYLSLNKETLINLIQELS